MKLLQETEILKYITEQFGEANVKAFEAGIKTQYPIIGYVTFVHDDATTCEQLFKVQGRTTFESFKRSILSKKLIRLEFLLVDSWRTNGGIGSIDYLKEVREQQYWMI